MPDLTIECRPWCKTNEDWEKKVAGSNGKTHTVTWQELPRGSETVYGWTCTCDAFRFGGGKECKHIKAVAASGERCAWNQEAAYGDGECDMPKNHKCPKCGGEMSAIRIGV